MSAKITSWYSLNEQQEQSFSGDEYKNYEVGQPVKVTTINSVTNQKTTVTVGYVSKVVHDTQTNDPLKFLASDGLDAYVVTQQSLGTPPSKVTDAAILYTGSNASAKNFGDLSNTISDWGGDAIETTNAQLNRIPGLGEIRNFENGGVDDQARSASDLLKQEMKQYPNANFYLTGHSKESMNVQGTSKNLSFLCQLFKLKRKTSSVLRFSLFSFDFSLFSEQFSCFWTFYAHRASFSRWICSKRKRL